MVDQKLAQQIAKLTDAELDDLASLIYEADTEKAMNLMRSISIADMENYLTNQPEPAL